MSLSTKIQQIISEGYDFKFGEYLSKGFELVNKNIGGFIAYTLLYLLMNMAASFLPGIGAIGMWLVGPALIIGFAIVANKVDRERPHTFNDFFGGFSKFSDLFLTTLLGGLLTVVAALPGIVLMGYSIYNSIVAMSDPENMESFSVDPSNPLGLYTQVFSFLGSGMGLVGLLLIMIPGIYFAVSFLWAPYLVWFHNIKPWEALQTSRKISAKNWWMTFLFVIVLGLIASAGLLLFCVGLLYTLPVLYASMYAAFADITELNNDTDDEEADVINHFAPIQ